MNKIFFKIKLIFYYGETMSINDEKDLIGIENASKVAKYIRDFLRKNCVAGVTTRYLDELCKTEMEGIDAKSAPRMFYGAPSYSFYSKNNKVVHGLPDDEPLKEGDILKIDVTPFYEGYISDTACSVVIGGKRHNPLAQKLIDNTIESFHKAIKKCKHANKVNEIGKAIEKNTIERGFYVIKELTGHGVGRAIHEEPTILNYYNKHQTDTLKTGLVIAIEPMIVNKKSDIRENSDGWTLQTRNGTFTAHYEHTVLITESEPIILTA